MAADGQGSVVVGRCERILPEETMPGNGADRFQYARIGYGAALDLIPDHAFARLDVFVGRERKP